MSELTTIPSSAGAAGIPAPARFFAGPRGFKLRPDLVLIGVQACLEVWGFTAPTRRSPGRYVAQELAEIGPWLVASVCIAGLPA
jgi:hypothetical protein